MTYPEATLATAEIDRKREVECAEIFRDAQITACLIEGATSILCHAESDDTKPLIEDARNFLVAWYKRKSPSLGEMPRI